ncbi:MAG: hypothetical protein M1818_007689 [Claussenomyces sp. TS43310]|nr:MAG: hypothetical protein M1818_007689 [Claussenomyces sp. TS43310]
MSTSPEHNAPLQIKAPSDSHQQPTSLTSDPSLTEPVPAQDAHRDTSPPTDQTPPQTEAQHTNVERPQLQPFFTLIADTATSMTHHPQQVHYLFSDDDTELLTAACLQASDPLTADTSADIASGSRHLQDPTSSSSSSIVYGEPQYAQDRARENRILLLDVDASGTKVVKAHSLTPNWQILSASLMPAPTWNAPTQEGQSEDNSTMLRIEGTDGYEGAKAKTKGLGLQDVSLGEEEFAALMQNFDEKMKLLRTIVDSGGDEHDQNAGRDLEAGEEELR